MAISDRLKDERLRLGLSQTAFAALAGATKSAQIKWEAGTSSAPTAPALAAFAEAGVDVLYVLTGRRTVERIESATGQIEEQIAAIRRNMLEITWEAAANEDQEKAEARALDANANALRAMLQWDTQALTPGFREEIESLLTIIADPLQLAAFRAADHAQHRAKRRRIRETIHAWIDLDDHQPNEAAIILMTEMAHQYGVPVGMLVELTHEIRGYADPPETSE